MPNGWLYDWEGIATIGSRTQRHVLVESLLVVYVCLFAIPNRCSKDSSCAHKGLVTNRPHHNMLCGLVKIRMMVVQLPRFGRAIFR
jgi:hypothetical protein